MLLGNKRSAKSAIKPWHLFAFLGLIFILFFTSVGTNLQSGINDNIPGGQQQTTQTSGLVSVSKTIQLTGFDSNAGSNCGAVTINLYDPASRNLLESLTASSAGVATSGNTYDTGDNIVVRISGNSKVTQYFPMTVPAMDYGSSIASSTNNVAIYCVTLGAWTMTNTGTGGTTFTSGTTYLIDAFTGGSVTITTTLSETTANAGYVSTKDIINPYVVGGVQQELYQYFVIRMTTTGTSLTINGWPRSVLFGSTTTKTVICPDGLSGMGYDSAYTVVSNAQSQGIRDTQCTGALSLKTIGNTNYGGAVTFVWSVADGALGSGSTQLLTLGMFYYYDPAYLKENNDGGPNDTQSGSDFTITFLSNDA